MPPTLSSQEKLRQGHALQLQGNFADATALYRQVLSAEPRNAPALHLLGVLVMQTGQVEEGVGLIRESLAILPGFAPAHDNLGKGLEMLGRKQEALTSFGRVIALAPGFPDGYVHRAKVLESLFRFADALKDFDKALALRPDPATHLNRGAILLQMQRPQEALAAFDKAIALGIAHPLAWFNRGLALDALNRPQEALASYDDAIMRQADYADAFVNRGMALESLNRPEEALASYERALAISPELQEAGFNRVTLLAKVGRREEALAGYDAAIARDPDFAIAHNNRGSVLKSMGEMPKALADFDRAIALKPDDFSLHDNRAATLQAMGRFEEAMAAFDQALTIDPGSERTRFHKSMLLLLQGHFTEGLPLYDQGLSDTRRTMALPATLNPATELKDAGRNVAGKHVFIYAEQGIGDIIQFARYLAELQAAGARVTLGVRDSLIRLFRSLTPAVTLIPENTLPPAIDLHAPLVRLPLLLSTTIDTIPARVPYLAAEPERVARWRGIIGDKGFRIGIAWQGKTKGYNDPFRSFPLAALAPLAKVAGVRLISLQKGDGLEQLQALPAGMTVETLGGDFDAGTDAFIDSAAAMQALDLVVTCDTSIAHLAGALARPVWVALKHVPDWRWQMERGDSPWYPTMTLFRQETRGDWDSVFSAMVARLAKENADADA